MAELQRMVSGMIDGKNDAPSGKSRKMFFATLSVNIDGVRARKWNYERVIVFQLVILKCAQAVINTKHSCARIQFIFHCWNSGVFGELVKDTFNVATGFLGKSRGIQSEEQCHHTFLNLVLKVKLRVAVIFFCVW